jgi:outer membrane receptor protein involved in Fe transport
MNHRGFAARAFLLSTVSILAVAMPALSQAQQILPEITVTAGKVSQKAQDVPSSLTVLPRTTLDDAGINTVQDLPRYVPNFLLSDQGSPRLSISTIRGIGSTVRDDYFNSSLGIYLDGVPLSTAEFNRRLGDIGQVEVLRGPQGTLYGHNTPAGVINLTSRAPTSEPKAGVLGTFGNKAQREGSLWVSGPLGDPSLTSRFFFDYAARDGFTKYLRSGNTIDNLESLTGSGMITGTGIAVIAVFGGGLGGLLARRFPVERVAVGSGLAAALGLGLWGVAAAYATLSTGLAMAIIATVGFAGGIAYVGFFTIFMRWSSLQQAGTDFTLLQCTESCTNIVAAIAAGQLAALLGYGGLFAVAVVIGVLAMGWNAFALSQIAGRRSDTADLHPVPGPVGAGS